MKAQTNFKVMTKPDLTDEEIRNHMDFDKLLQSYHRNSTTHQIPKWVKIFGVAVVATVTVFTVTYVYRQPSSSSNAGKQTERQINVDTTATVATNNILHADSQKTANAKSAPPAINRLLPKQQKKDTPQIERQTTSRFIEATPVDGYPALYAYFDRELKYPTATNDSIQGIVIVSFAITKAGNVDFIKIENSLGAAFDAECVRVIQNMPRWKPATIDNKPAQTRLSIPLSFKIKKNL
jgi:TonB family protein